MKTFFLKTKDKYKKLFLYLVGSVILFSLDIFIMYGYMMNNAEAIEEFLETSVITSEILPFTILSFIAMVLGLIIIALILIIVIKAIIPSKKAFSSIVMKDEANFLLGIPKILGEEISKHGK